ncbi:hypothetical protein EV1_002125 [Malus domestica]
MSFVRLDAGRKLGLSLPPEELRLRGGGCSVDDHDRIDAGRGPRPISIRIWGRRRVEELGGEAHDDVGGRFATIS